MFPQICNKPVQCDTRERSFSKLDGRNVVVDAGRFARLVGLKCFVDPVFGAIVNISNISTLPTRFPAHSDFVLPRALFKGVGWSVHKAKSKFFVGSVTCDDPTQFHRWGRRG